MTVGQLKDTISNWLSFEIKGDTMTRSFARSETPIMVRVRVSERREVVMPLEFVGASRSGTGERDDRPITITLDIRDGEKRAV